MEKAAVALDYCNPHSCVWAEQGAWWTDQHTLIGYMRAQVVVLSTVELLGIYNCLNVEMQDKNPQREGRHSCFGTQ